MSISLNMKLMHELTLKFIKTIEMTNMHELTLNFLKTIEMPHMHDRLPFICYRLPKNLFVDIYKIFSLYSMPWQA